MFMAIINRLLISVGYTSKWLPGQVWHLHLDVNDATGMVTGAWVETQATLSGFKIT